MNPYPSYKESGIEWVGDIPNKWKKIKGKHLFGHRVQKNNINEPLLSVTQDKGVVRRDKLDYRVWNPQDDTSTLKLVLKGDFVISLRTFEGGIELSNVRGIVSTTYTPLFSKKDICHHYYKYLFKSFGFITELNTITSGIRQGKNISYDDFSGLYLLFPSLQEQQQISNYLDHKTNQIDSLIKKTQQKIELLKESILCHVNECFIKNTSLVERQEDWFQRIPEDWKVITLRSFFKVIHVRGFGDERLLSVTQDKGVVYRDEQVNSVMNPLGDTSHYKLVEPGDFIISLRSSEGGFELSEIRGTVSPVYTVLRPTHEVDLVFYKYLLKSYNFIIELNRFITGIRDGKSINFVDIRNVRIPVKDLSKTTKLDEIVVQEHRDIYKSFVYHSKKNNLLKEYRQSLISEVVTGKIDVRDEVVV